jgi:ADP-ribose pyrophosphatase
MSGEKPRSGDSTGTDAEDDPNGGDGPSGSTDTSDSADPLAWETLSAKVAYSCPGFDVRHEEVRLPDGTGTDFDSLDEPPAVVVLPFTPDGEVVVIEEWRQAVGRVNRGLPAGSVEPGDESLAAAARRELSEETGYEAGSVEFLTTVEPSNGVSNALHHQFVAHDCRPAGDQALDADESIRVDTATLDALDGAIADGTLRDGRSALCVLYYERFGDG